MGASEELVKFFNEADNINWDNLTYEEEQDLSVIKFMSEVTHTKYSNEQLNILRHRGGMCILASAGSGKTTTLNHLIAKRIQTGEIANTSKLLCTTFSKSGANEMGQRLDQLLSQLGINKKATVRTLHSVYFSLLRDLQYSLDVVDDSVKLHYIREASKECNITLEDDDYKTLESILSYQVNNLMSDKSIFQSYIFTLRDSISLEDYSKLRALFNRKKQEAGKIDFDDMQLMVYQLLRSEQYGPALENYCHSLWDYIYIDEAQDISKIQFAILKRFIADPNNLVIIGDDDQSLVAGTKVIMNGKEVDIESVGLGDKVLCGCGWGRVGEFGVRGIEKRAINEQVVVIETRGGHKLKGTRGHIGFARLSPNSSYHYTFLMYKHGFGYRLGVTGDNRTGGTSGTSGEIGTDGKVGTDGNIGGRGLSEIVLSNNADKAWILQASTSVEEAKLLVHSLSKNYGITVGDFKAEPDNQYSTEDPEDIKLIVNTGGPSPAVLKLLCDCGVDWKYPHYTIGKQVGTKADTEKGHERFSINYTLMGNNDKVANNMSFSSLRAQGNSRWFKKVLTYHMHTSTIQDTTGHTHIDANEFSVDETRLGRIMKDIMEEARLAGKYLEPIREANITEETTKFMSLGNMVPGMLVPVYSNGTMVEDEITAVYEEQYSGYVYDLDIPGVRNFVANGISVHNCIYQWRGADPSIILNICGTYPVLTRFTLTTNYRCLSNIVDRAAHGIKFNRVRSDKGMTAFGTGGDIRLCDTGKGNLYEMSKYAYKYIKELVIDKGVNPKDIAVLCRNNQHLTILGNMLFKDGIFCDQSHEMRFTQCVAYRLIGKLFQLADNTTNGNITASELWKCCMYMNKRVSNEIGKLQSTYGVRLSDILGLVLTEYCHLPDIKWDNPGMKVGNLDYSKYTALMGQLKSEAIGSLVLIYNLLAFETNTKAAQGILSLFLSTKADLFYKSEESSRFINGYIQYMNTLIESMGFNNFQRYIRSVEQFESGKMAVMSPKVTMSTMHGAKGKEWKYVILFADDNVSFPSFSNIQDCLKNGVPDLDIRCMIDENRRLHYVAFTRAKEHLTIFGDKDNLSLYTLESLNVMDYGDSNDTHIIAMAQHGVYRELLDRAKEELFSPLSPYFMEVDTNNLQTNVEIKYTFDQVEADKKKDTVNINDMQTYTPMVTGE